MSSSLCSLFATVDVRMSGSGVETRTSRHPDICPLQTNPCLDESGMSGEISRFQRSFTDNQVLFTDFRNPILRTLLTALPARSLEVAYEDLRLTL